MIKLKNSIFKGVENAKININYVKTEDAIKLLFTIKKLPFLLWLGN